MTKIVILVLFFLAQVSHATVLPLLEPANTRMYPLDDHRVDMALRIAAIDRATVDTPILLITYNLGADQVIGLPVLHALRRAADRGVSVRVLSSMIPSSVYDRGGLARRMLTDKTLRRPIEFIEFGGFNNLTVGLNLTDSIHQKILKIGDDLVFFGGRNTDSEVNFLDLSFAIRPLVDSAPSLASQLSHVAEDIWALVRRIQKPYAPLFLPGITGRIPYDDEYWEIDLGNETRRLSMQSALAFLDLPGDAPPLPLEARPRKVRVITNDCIANALTGIFGRRLKNRARMPDEIVEKISTLISNGKEIDLVAMSLFMVKNLKDSLLTALHNGAVSRIFTNSLKSAVAFVPLGLPYLESLPLMVELLQIPNAKLAINTMTPDEEYRYLHMKLLRVDDTVAIGSSNFNIPSTTSNDEVMVFFEDDPAFSQWTKNMIDQRFQQKFQNITCEMALSDHKGKRTFLRRIISSVFKVFY